MATASIKSTSFFGHKDTFKTLFNSLAKHGTIPMLCQTVKEGFECVFMTKKGCTFNGGSCHPITEKCEGCDRCVEYSSVKYCMMYPDPAGKWNVGGCPS